MRHALSLCDSPEFELSHVASSHHGGQRGSGPHATSGKDGGMLSLSSFSYGRSTASVSISNRHRLPLATCVT